LIIEGDDDLRRLPLQLRKTILEPLLARRPEGVFINPFERGEIGPDLFWAACRYYIKNGTSACSPSGVISYLPSRTISQPDLTISSPVCNEQAGRLPPG
jgi:hypothetical protein